MLIVLVASGCASNKNLSLIPAPVLYNQTNINPFAHLKSDKKTTYNTVHFATLRNPEFTKGTLTYGNDVSNRLHLGRAQVQIGSAAMQWQELERYSLSGDDTQLIPLTLAKTTEIAQLSKTKQTQDDLTKEQQQFIDRPCE